MNQGDEITNFRMGHMVEKKSSNAQSLLLAVHSREISAEQNVAAPSACHFCQTITVELCMTLGIRLASMFRQK